MAGRLAGCEKGAVRIVHCNSKYSSIGHTQPNQTVNMIGTDRMQVK